MILLFHANRHALAGSNPTDFLVAADGAIRQSLNFAGVAEGNESGVCHVVFCFVVVAEREQTNRKRFGLKAKSYASPVTRCDSSASR